MTPEERIHELESLLIAERDRRYTEVQAERDKALAHQFAESQRHDETTAQRLNNILERLGHCTTHDDFEAFRRERETTLKPLMEFVAAQQGRDSGSTNTRSLFFAVGGLIVGVLTMVVIWATSVKH